MAKLNSRPKTAPVATSTHRVCKRPKARTKGALEAGTSSHPASFIVIDNPEATVAAYCGFRDIGAFRRFYMSGLVLPFYVQSLSYKEYAKRKVLSLLEDVPYDQYWASNEDADIVYPLGGENANLNYGIALIAWQLLRNLRKCLPSDCSSAVQTSFTELTGCRLPDASALSKEDISTFRPFGDESELEALNRCLCLFAHLRYTTSKSQWEKRFFGSSPWDRSFQIPDEYKPGWMREHKAAKNELRGKGIDKPESNAATE